MVASRTEPTTLEHVDIAAYSARGELQLIVEVKSKSSPTVTWAANMRRNLAAHLTIPDTPYFLLATLDRFYLWKNKSSSPEVVPPDHDVDAQPLLAPYIDNARRAVVTISDYGLTLAVSSWLTDLVNSDISAHDAPSHQQWLFESGLYEAVKCGMVR